MSFPVQKVQYGSYGYFLQEVGGYLGYGHDQETWDHNKFGVVDSLVQRGVQAFYSPPPTGGSRYAHEWSFLQPYAELTTEADTYEYELPVDFTNIDGPMTFAPGSDVLYRPVEVVSIHKVMIKLEEGTWTGRPEMAAVRVKEHDPLRGSVSEVLFWPTPDDAYTLHYRYKVAPALLTNETPMPYGGLQHVNAILESCLAFAEEKRAEDVNEQPTGVHRVNYMVALSASVSADQKLASPATMGYNGARTSVTGRYDQHDMDLNIVKYGGVEIDG